MSSVDRSLSLLSLRSVFSKYSRVSDSTHDVVKLTRYSGVLNYLLINTTNNNNTDKDVQ